MVPVLGDRLVPAPGRGWLGEDLLRGGLPGVAGPL